MNQINLGAMNDGPYTGGHYRFRLLNFIIAPYFVKLRNPFEYSILVDRGYVPAMLLC